MRNLVIFLGGMRRREEFRATARRLIAEREAAPAVVRRLVAMDLEAGLRFLSAHRERCSGMVVDGLLAAAKPLPAWRRDDLTALAVVIALGLPAEAGAVHVAASRVHAWMARATLLLESGRAEEALSAATAARATARDHAALWMDVAAAERMRAEALAAIGRGLDG